MDQQITDLGDLSTMPARLPNATQGKPYACEPIRLNTGGATDFTFSGLDAAGLSVRAAESEDSYEFAIVGTPAEPGDYAIALRWRPAGWQEGDSFAEKQLRLLVNPNPRLLWRNIPTPPDVQFYKPDQDEDHIDACGGKRVIAASQRGRSHAQEGKPRDDHFLLSRIPGTDWLAMAVADGAGSAKYSRHGSEIACLQAVDYCKNAMSDATGLEEAIRNYHTSDDEPAARKALGNKIYSIIGNAAYRAHRAIAEEAKTTDDASAKDFATTLLLAICKKFDFGWFIASFWVGDGAIAIYDKESHSINLLGVPDEGEYSGQTRFLTMPEIFADTASLYRRLRFDIRPDFTALMLMTDGVSDPMFGTDSNLNNPDCWDRFWTQLQAGYPDDGIGAVDLDSPHASEQLLDWLGFWVPGEHDDRTIAILY